MNNLKKNYTNKLRRRILKESKIPNKKFVTNYKDIKKYFKYLNNILFKDKLNYFNDIKKISLNDHSGPGFFQEAGILNIKDINTIINFN